MLYSLYTRPLGDIARSHGLSYHFYADDSQLYLSFKTLFFEDMVSCKSKEEVCVTDIDSWMIMNQFKTNSDKTQILVFSWSNRPRPALDFLDIVSENVRCSTTAKNIGVVFSNSLSMAPHIAAVCKSSFFHLRNIFKVLKFLSVDSAKTLANYCNSLLYGQPKCVLRDLQCVLNCSAQLIYSTSKFEHVTALFLNLHWLPGVEQRIIFKIALITFEALHDSAPSYITELIRPYKPDKTLRSSSHNLLTVPRFNLKTYGVALLQLPLRPYGTAFH